MWQILRTLYIFCHIYVNTFFFWLLFLKKKNPYFSRTQLTLSGNFKYRLANLKLYITHEVSFSYTFGHFLL